MRTDQGGSVVSFLVVGIVFVAIIIGAVYTLQHRTSNNPSPTPSSPVVTTNTPATPTPTPSVSTPQTGTGTNNTNSTSTGADGSSATMPVTGPADMMPGGVVVALLVGALVAFLQSVKARRNLAV